MRRYSGKVDVSSPAGAKISHQFNEILSQKKIHDIIKKNVELFFENEKASDLEIKITKEP